MSNASYKKLVVWQKAHQLAKLIYQETMNFPQQELYGVTSQLRRSALSVPLNIVEGSNRLGPKELKRFISIALGSLAETEYLIDFSSELNYLSIEMHKQLKDLRQEVGNLLWKFYLSCK